MKTKTPLTSQKKSGAIKSSRYHPDAAAGHPDNPQRPARGKPVTAASRPPLLSCFRAEAPGQVLAGDITYIKQKKDGYILRS